LAILITLILASGIVIGTDSNIPSSFASHSNVSLSLNKIYVSDDYTLKGATVVINAFELHPDGKDVG